MSRSHRHTPICGMTTARTEKWFKAASSRILRAVQKRLLRRTDPDALTLPTKSREVVETWTGPKDGKQRFDPSTPWGRREMRK